MNIVNFLIKKFPTSEIFWVFLLHLPVRELRLKKVFCNISSVYVLIITIYYYTRKKWKNDWSQSWCSRFSSSSFSNAGEFQYLARRRSKPLSGGILLRHVRRKRQEDTLRNKRHHPFPSILVSSTYVYSVCIYVYVYSCMYVCMYEWKINARICTLCAWICIYMCRI